MKPGPPSTSTCLYRALRSYLYCDTSCRLRRRAALHPVADVEHDHAVVPVARVEQAVADVDVVQRAAGVRTAFRLPPRDFLRVIRVVDVENVQRARAVVREIEERAELVLLVHEDRMHAAGDALGELGDHFRMRRIVERADDDAVLAIARAFAREDEKLSVGERHDVVHAARVRRSPNR